MFYVDTSVIVAALVVETGSDRAREWFGKAPAQTLHTSDWSLAEFSSALSLKIRTNQISEQQRAASLAAFHELLEESFNILSVSRDHFRLASLFSDRHELAVKAGDALHLAIASEDRLTLCTLDRGLARAGPKLGVATELL